MLLQRELLSRSVCLTIMNYSTMMTIKILSVIKIMNVPNHYFEKKAKF